MFLSQVHFIISKYEKVQEAYEFEVYEFVTYTTISPNPAYSSRM